MQQYVAQRNVVGHGQADVALHAQPLQLGFDAAVAGAAGLDPDHLPESDPSAMNFGGDAKKAWKDIWGCGQGIGAIDAVVPAAERIARLRREYEAARARLCGLGR